LINDLARTKFLIGISLMVG